MNEDEIDLRPYIAALLEKWHWIVGTAVLAAVVALGVTSLLPAEYEAETAVAIVRSRTDVRFDSRIITQEEDLASTDLNARRLALVALVKSYDVVEQVLLEMGERLPLEERTVLDLMERIDVSNEGDLILIRARHTDPVMAAAIANAWAEHYTGHANTIYGAASLTNRENLTQQVTIAHQGYEAAQSRLEAFVANNRLATLQREIEARQALLDTYQSSRTALQTRPVDLQLSSEQQVLADYYEDLRRVERWLADAHSLRSQVEARSTSTASNLGNLLALVALQNRIFGSSVPVDLQVDLTTGGVDSVPVADVDVIIAVLEERRDVTNGQILALRDGLIAVAADELVIGPENPLTLRITQLNDEILALQAELAAQRATENELRQSRDLNWETYQTLVRKQAETEIAIQTLGSEVRVAGRAAVPEEPAGAGRLLSMAAAGFLALLATIFFIWAALWWQTIESMKDETNDEQSMA